MTRRRAKSPVKKRRGQKWQPSSKHFDYPVNEVVRRPHRSIEQRRLGKLAFVFCLCSAGRRSTSALSLRSVTIGPGNGSPSAAILSKTSEDNSRSLNTCETRTLDTPSLRARSAADEHSPLCQGRLPLSGLCNRIAIRLFSL